MTTAIHRELLVAATDLDFGVAFAEIDTLPAGDLCWTAPITTWEDCDFAEVFASIKIGTVTVGGTLEFYAGRSDGTLRAASGLTAQPLSDHDVEPTAAIVTQVLNCLGNPLATVQVGADDDSEVLVCTFRIWYPGANCNLFLYNNTDGSLDGTSSPHQVRGRGWGPVVQTA